MAQDDNMVASFIEIIRLKKLYTEKLKRLGVEVSGRISSTRLKEILLADMNRKDIALSYKNDIGTVINCVCESSFDSDAVVLARAAKIVHREILIMKINSIDHLAKTVLKHLHLILF